MVGTSPRATTCETRCRVVRFVVGPRCIGTMSDSRGQGDGESAVGWKARRNVGNGETISAVGACHRSASGARRGGVSRRRACKEPQDVLSSIRLGAAAIAFGGLL